MNPTMQDMLRQMQDATRLTQAGQLHEATQVIQRALAGRHEASGAAAPGASELDRDAFVIDGCVFEVADVPAADTAAVPEPASTPRDAGAGEFSAGTFTHTAGTRGFKLYVPPQAFVDAGELLPLVLMLHGCTQNPDDFAAGTGMNLLAREQGFYVLYPAQAQSANPSGCWNWFKHNHQARGRGEPALLAALTHDVMARHRIDPKRVYAAGLSAGGAMAAVLAQAYPDLYAAVGVHSGLPVGSANDMVSALAVMKDGRAARSKKRARQAAAAPMPAHPMHAVPGASPVPTIVFHGDVDTTVHPRNGEQLVAFALGVADITQAAALAAAPLGTASAAHGTHRPAAARGPTRHHTRRVYRHGPAVAEHWVVHGAGHAWSGGRHEGTFTDPQGPDASAEMLRFFLEHPLRSAGE